ncbi:hypothetical protein LCGC14_2601930 [marine sediment metagenome]|uniref:Uncharacterized protein n=1 Tax=marine sediment metagenome TaxID=412755 RepID=A0A0F9A8G9_9ZZZZ
MAIKKHREHKTGKFEFKGFVNLEFTPDERQAMGDWLDTFNDSASDSIAVLTEAMYKVGFSYDDHNEAYSITITCKYRSSPYFGYCFVLRHSDITRGINILRRVYDTLLVDGLYNMQTGADKYDW